MTNQSLSAAEIAEVRDLFYRFDHNNDGVIERTELIALLEALGGDTFAPNINEVLASFDKNGDGVIQFGEFLAWFSAQ